MAEPRRVQLTALSCPVPAAAPVPVPVPVPEPPPASGSVRLLVRLFEPDERHFPEFSYIQLLEEQINQTQSDAPLNTPEEKEVGEKDEIAAITRRLEEKHGGKPKKKDRIQDLIDIGYGYDDEDSFIDNSEAYDEFVPASITTKFGGFYVNSGTLQYRQASDVETNELTVGKETSAQKKRKLPGGQDRPKVKRHREAKSGTDPNKRNPCDDMKMKRKKTLSVTSMLKKFQREKERERQKREAAAPPPADAAGGGGLLLTDPLLSLIGLTDDQALMQAANTVDFDVDLDSLLDVSEETPIQTKPDDQTLPSCSAEASVKNPSTISRPKPFPELAQLASEGSSSTPCTQLPDRLPPGLEQSIRKLAVAAKTSEGESKLKFFSPDINAILLDIELQCREHAGPLRSKVYTHLSSFLPCSRDTLLKRVKRLVITHTVKEENLGVEDTMKKLRDAIGRSMPEQIAGFIDHCEKYEQMKSCRPVDEDNVEDRGGRRGPPKKIFQWNEEIRECLNNVLNERINKYKERTDSLEIDEYLKTLLDNEVKSLWPKGWMQSRVLLSQSRRLLGLVPPLPVKRARPEKKPSDLEPDGVGATSAPGPRLPPPPRAVGSGGLPHGALEASPVNRASSPQLPKPDDVQIYVISDDDCVITE